MDETETNSGDTEWVLRDGQEVQVGPRRASQRQVESALLLALRDTMPGWPIMTGSLRFFMELSGRVASNRTIAIVLRQMLDKRLVFRVVEYVDGRRRIHWGLERAGLFEARALAGVWWEGDWRYPPSPEAMFESEAA
jgi:hypothetical protein